ncbi:flagellar filament capping protein FliD [Paludibacterium paludis]|uniref:Flagellar hook-associated protein 2 n=1 Tax=Paludibacterium paludis TaxID=1225769 RepID=A0A918P6G2_9NEIS|nr:flagellar filament capping protein FliD [Paludibacterium paludis]GGY25715.1 flagellar hook-associated protein 2 [Paludibacterium paludis]
MSNITTQVGPLDVQGLVSQLMTVERQPLVALQKKASTYQSQLSDLGKLKSDISSLQSTLSELSSGTFLNASKLTSSSQDVLTGSSTSFALAGVYNVNVQQIAQGQSVAFANQPSASNPLGNAADSLLFHFQDGSPAANVAIKANASLNDIASAVNAAGIGINATIVNSGDPANPGTLVFSSTKTGNGKAFTTSLQTDDAALNFLKFDPSVADDPRLTARAQDAIVQVNGVTMHNDTNSLTSGITGVTLTLSKPGTSSVTVSRDDTAIQAKVQAFVDAYNKVRATAESLRKGSMKGDASIQSVESMLQSVLTTPISGVDPTRAIGYLAQIGITQNGTSAGANGSTVLDGSLKFDATAFINALNGNLAGVAHVFGNANNDGVADRLNRSINDLLGPTGVLETATSAVNSTMQDEKLQEDLLNTRLDSIQKAYLTQFTNLNASLAQIQKTSDYLTRSLA